MIEGKFQTFEFGKKVIIVDTIERSCIGVDKNLFHEADLENEDSILRKGLNKKRILASNHNLDRVNTIYLLVTNKCNLSCEFCSVRADKHSFSATDSIKLDIFRQQVFPLLQELNPRRLIITGGEPLMNEDIINIAKMVREKMPDIYIMVQSNGFLIQDNKVLELLSKYIDSIEISSSHYSDLKELEKKIDIIKKKNIHVAISYLSDGNVEKLCRIVDFVVEKNVGFLLNFVSPLGSAIDNKVKILTYQERIDVFKRLAEYILEKKYFNNNLLELFRQRIIARTSCNALGKMLAIYPNGKCYICHSLETDDFCVGNCRENGKDVLLDNLDHKIREDKVRDLMDVDYKNICKDCKLKYLCGGICGAIKYNHTDTVDICKLQKFFLAYNLLVDQPEKGDEYNLHNFITLCDKKEEVYCW